MGFPCSFGKGLGHVLGFPGPELRGLWVLAASHGRSRYDKRLREYRQRVRDDPVKHQEYLRKERERNKKRKEEGKLKCISDLPNREQKKVRKSWRKRQQKHKTFAHMVQYIYGQSFGNKTNNFPNISNLTLHQFGRMAHIHIFRAVFPDSLSLCPTPVNHSPLS